jgi:acetoin utilization deacetylase AcuC-like enzyme
MPMLLRMRLSTILLAGLFTNAAVIAAFAGLMYAAGPDCLVFHDDDTHFGNGTRPLFYERVLWISMHSFTTIGYGSGFPSCTSTQLVLPKDRTQVLRILFSC